MDDKLYKCCGQRAYCFYAKPNHFALRNRPLICKADLNRVLVQIGDY